MSSDLQSSNAPFMHSAALALSVSPRLASPSVNRSTEDVRPGSASSGSEIASDSPCKSPPLKFVVAPALTCSCDCLERGLFALLVHQRGG